MIQLIQRNIDKRKLDLDLSIGLLCAFTNEQAQILEVMHNFTIIMLLTVFVLINGEILNVCCKI